MEDLLRSFVHEITSRPSGPLSFRFILQPLMAAGLAVRAGIRDARAGAPAYLWAVFTRPEHRHHLLRDGWHDIARIFALAVVIDLIFQLLVLKGVRPLETLLIGFLLAILPYIVVRGPVNRLLRRTRSKGKPHSH